MFRGAKDGDGAPSSRVARAAAATVAGIVGLILLISLLAAWPFKKVPNGYVSLSYGGGVFEGQSFQGQRYGPQGIFFNGWADALYLYPTTQRSYIISLTAGEGDRGEPDSIVAPTHDRINVTYQVAVYFKLNVDTVQKFHQNIGLKYHAWCNVGERDCSDGWLQMLNDSFRQQIESALQQESRTVESVDIQSDPDTIVQIQIGVGSVLKDRVARVLGDDYFCGPTYIPGQDECPDFTFIIKKATLPDGVVAEYERNQESLIAVQTERNKVEQAEQQAKQIEIVSKALAGASAQYTLLKAIESGKVTFWVLPDGTPITIPRPGG